MVLLCGGVYLGQRSLLLRNVDQGLKSTASRARLDVRERKLSDLTTINDGLRYQVVLSSGQPVPPSTSGQAADLGLPIQSLIRRALMYGSDLRTMSSPSGKMRVYSLRITPTLAVQVARSI